MNAVRYCAFSGASKTALLIFGWHRDNILKTVVFFCPKQSARLTQR